MLQNELVDPPWYIDPMYYNSPIVSYYTDASIYNNTCCCGYIEYNKPRDTHNAVVFNINKMDIHYAELVAINNLLCHIVNNCTKANRYEINTDSDTAMNYIKNNKYQESRDINMILDSNPNISIRCVKSHLNNPSEQQRYLRKKGEIVSKNKALDIINGNKKIDAIVKGCATAQGNIKKYSQIPFRIDV